MSDKVVTLPVVRIERCDDDHGHTPTPWATDGSYVVAKFGPTIADCGKSPSMDRREQRANVDFIIKAVNNHDALVKALATILEANQDFRDGLPPSWDGDPLQDACDAAKELLASVSSQKEPS